MTVQGEQLEKVVETLMGHYPSEIGTYEGVLDYDTDRGWVDIDRVNVHLPDVMEEHGCYVKKLKEDANPDDGVVRVWFREVTLG